MPLYIRPTPQAVVATQYNAGLSPAVWPAANRAVYMRFQLTVATPVRYFNWKVDTQSGNVQVGVVSLSGANRTSYTRVMNSGVIACPAAADIRTDLGLSLLGPGDYAMFLWADNTTFQTRYSTAASLTTMRQAGLESSLAGGVTTSGTVTWSSAFINCALEADV